MRRTIAEVLAGLRTQLGPEPFDAGKFDLASKLFEQMMTGSEFPEFLTLVAYDYID